MARPRLLCVSMMMSIPPEQALEHARSLRKAIPTSVLIAVGGAATRTLEAASSDGLLFCPTYSALQAAMPTVWAAG
jgi:hypothetical protein